MASSAAREPLGTVLTMTDVSLRDIYDLVASSAPYEWYRLPHSSSGSAVHVAQHEVVSTQEHPMYVQDVRRHSDVAIHRRLPHLALAWGLPWREGRDFHLPTVSSRMADPSISADLVDILWYGTVIYRGEFMHVDGGRCILPVPRALLSSLEVDDVEIIAEQVSSWELALAGLIDQMYAGHDFERYVKQAGLHPVDRHPLDE